MKFAHFFALVSLFSTLALSSPIELQEKAHLKARQSNAQQDVAQMFQAITAKLTALENKAGAASGQGNNGAATTGQPGVFTSTSGNGQASASNGTTTSTSGPGNTKTFSDEQGGTGRNDGQVGSVTEENGNGGDGGDGQNGQDGQNNQGGVFTSTTGNGQASASNGDQTSNSGPDQTNGQPNNRKRRSIAVVEA